MNDLTVEQRLVIRRLIAAAQDVIRLGVSNRSGVKYAEKRAAFDALDDAAEAAEPLYVALLAPATPKGAR